MSANFKMASVEIRSFSTILVYTTKFNKCLTTVRVTFHLTELLKMRSLRHLPKHFRLQLSIPLGHFIGVHFVMYEIGRELSLSFCDEYVNRSNLHLKVVHSHLVDTETTRRCNQTKTRTRNPQMLQLFYKQH